MQADSSADVRDTLRRIGAMVFERGWLSSNNVLFAGHGAVPSTLVDTAHHSHSDLTITLVRDALGGEPLERIVNTHLHSDHCGGNAALQGEWGCHTIVPQASFEMARTWDEAGLSYLRSGQACPRFAVHSGVQPGAMLQLGHWEWQVHAAPGHDPLAVMFFQPENRVLISGDALWEHGLAIIFPELEGGEGFGHSDQTLALIEQLNPVVVIPGHGRPFSDVPAALEQSRQRLAAFAADPTKHAEYAARALVMFHMLEAGRATRREVIGWMSSTPLMGGVDPASVIGRLLTSGALRSDADWLLLGL